jgi:hypothetical protein
MSKPLDDIMPSRTVVGEPVQGRPGYFYRAFDDPEDALGPDVSMDRKPFGWGGAYEIEFTLAEAVPISHHPGAYRGAFSPARVTRVFYEPDYWIEEVRVSKLDEDLPRLRKLFPHAEFVEVQLADDAETRIVVKVEN